MMFPSSVDPCADNAPLTSAPPTLASSCSAILSSTPSACESSISALLTSVPSTSEPSTSAPSTSAPSTSAPSTSAPSTSAPSTSAPSTSAPSTSEPSTSEPSTSEPSTSEPSTSAPQTLASTAPVSAPQRSVPREAKISYVTKQFETVNSRDEPCTPLPPPTRVEHLVLGTHAGRINIVGGTPSLENTTTVNDVMIDKHGLSRRTLSRAEYLRKSEKVDWLDWDDPEYRAPEFVSRLPPRFTLPGLAVLPEYTDSTGESYKLPYLGFSAGVSGQEPVSTARYEELVKANNAAVVKAQTERSKRVPGYLVKYDSDQEFEKLNSQYKMMTVPVNLPSTRRAFATTRMTAEKAVASCEPATYLISKNKAIERATGRKQGPKKLGLPSKATRRPPARKQASKPTSDSTESAAELSRRSARIIKAIKARQQTSIDTGSSATSNAVTPARMPVAKDLASENDAANKSPAEKPAAEAKVSAKRSMKGKLARPTKATSTWTDGKKLASKKASSDASGSELLEGGARAANFEEGNL